MQSPFFLWMEDEVDSFLSSPIRESNCVKTNVQHMCENIAVNSSRIIIKVTRKSKRKCRMSKVQSLTFTHPSTNPLLR